MLRNDIMITDIELIWLQIHLPHCKPTLVGCCHRPPSSNVNYLDKICETFDMVTDESKDIFLLGDLNIDWFSKNCPLRKKLILMASVCNLTQVVTQPTRISITTDGVKISTCIDHIFTNIHELCSQAVSVAVGCSDHNLIALTRKTKMIKSGVRIVYRRSYKRFNPDSFVDDVQDLQWSDVCLVNDVNIAMKNFMDKFVKLVDKHAPLRKRSVKGSSALWLDDELRYLMLQRDNAKTTAQKSGCSLDKNIYCKLRNKVTNLNYTKKREYFKQKICNSVHDTKKLWKTLNELMCKKSRKSPNYVECAGQLITRPYEVANYFNNFFINKVDRLRSCMQLVDVNLPCSIVKDIMSDKTCSFAFDTVIQDTVEEMLHSLSDDTSPGIDNLDGKIFNIVASLLSKPICHIFNRSLLSGTFPEPLPKDGKAGFTGSNCRPISILPVLSKILEKIIFNQMLNYFSSNGLLSKAQHAYRPGHSTSTALVHMRDQWLTNIEDRKLVGAVLLDFTAAFDVIDHSILLAKLKCYGVLPLALAWIKSYLSGRSQRVFFNGCFSDSRRISFGVPQGSCLGSLLFSIFINDLPCTVRKADVVMYADDATLFCASPMLGELNANLQLELHTIINWVKMNKLVLNIAKTKCIVFGSRNVKANATALSLSIDGILVEQVTKTTLLGVKLDSLLSWSDQIDHIVSMMGKGIAMSRKCSGYVPPSVMNDVVRSLVLSHLEYCPVIWSSAAQKHLKKLQIAQNRAATLVLCCSFRANVSEMHNQLSWLTVEAKLKSRLLSFMHTVILKNTPQFFGDKLVYSGFCHGYVTRQVSTGLFVAPSPRTNFMMRTVLYRGVSVWNMLPTSIRQIKNRFSFKKSLKLKLMNHT